MLSSHNHHKPTLFHLLLCRLCLSLIALLMALLLGRTTTLWDTTTRPASICTTAGVLPPLQATTHMTLAIFLWKGKYILLPGYVISAKCCLYWIFWPLGPAQRRLACLIPQPCALVPVLEASSSEAGEAWFRAASNWPPPQKSRRSDGSLIAALCFVPSEASRLGCAGRVRGLVAVLLRGCWGTDTPLAVCVQHSGVS